MSNEAATISLRPVQTEDEAFLSDLYASTRAAEMAAWGWDERQRELFLRMQFRARDQSYRMAYQGMDDQVILVNGREAGRLILDRNMEEIRIVDIALLPEYRSARVGTFLIQQLFAEADETQRAVRLQVEKTNEGARRLYDRAGFSVVGENQTHTQMERKALPQVQG